MKLLILILSVTAMTAFAGESETTGAPDISKVECECWGSFGGYYDERPPFLIGVVESWGYCPTHISSQELYKFHVDKNKIKCSMLGETSASRHLQHCKKNF